MAALFSGKGSGMIKSGPCTVSHISFDFQVRFPLAASAREHLRSILPIVSKFA